MLLKKEAPRFHNKTRIPDIPTSLKLVKYKGHPAVVPRETEGEEVVGSGFTRKQLQALAYLKRSEIGRLNEEALAVVALETKNFHIKDQIDQIYTAYSIAVAGGEQYLASGLIRQALILQEFAP